MYLDLAAIAPAQIHRPIHLLTAVNLHQAAAVVLPAVVEAHLHQQESFKTNVTYCII